MEKIKAILNRMKENYKKNRIAVSILLVIWVLAIVVTLFLYRETLGKISTGNEAYDEVVELIDGVNVEETLFAVEGSDALAIKMATYARKNTGNFNVKVTGFDSKKVYADKTIDVNTLQDNAFVVIGLNEKLDPNIDSRIQIVMSSKCQKGSAAGVYYSNAKAYEGSLLKIGTNMKSGDLSLRFMCESKELHLFYMIVISWVITTFTIIMLMILVIKPKYEVLFTVIAICFGLTFWLIITPMSVPDETIHYEYSFQLSNKIMGSKDHMVFNEEYQNYGAMAGHLNISAAYERFIKKINEPLELRDNDVEMLFDIDNSYTTCFIPQALGITVGRLLKLNMLRTFYLGRLFNLTFYVVCVYIAIKNTPVRKILFGILATLPIFMQQAASFSYDCFINGLTFVIIAYLMKWMHTPELISKKDFIIAFIANLLIAPIKVVYSLFSLLYWFIPSDRFGSKKNKIIGVLIITAPAMYELFVLLAPLVFRIFRKIFERVFAFAAISKVYADEIGNNISNILDAKVLPVHLDGETYSFSYVTDHPIEMLILFARTVRYSIKTWFYASFGRALSGSTLILPTWMVHSLLGLIIIAALREEKVRESIFFKIAIVITCIMAGIMMVGGMLISWTEVEQVVVEDFGGPIIQGIQGRYFSPLLPYLFLVLNNKKIKIPEKLDSYILYAFVFLVFEVIVYVLSYTSMN